jgi:hypothetical protein
MMVKKLAVILALMAASPPAASASPGYAVAGLRVQPQVVALGAAPVGSCTGSTLPDCNSRTITLTNVGTETIAISGFGIPAPEFPSFALGLGTPASGCEFLQLIGGHWALAPGASCDITVLFVPRERGLVRQELDVWGVPLDLSAPIAVVPLLGVGT